MGDPKNSRKIWKKPKRPFNYDLKMEELKTVGTFGLRTKKELWKERTELSRIRNQARSLLALQKRIRDKRQHVFIESLVRIGVVKKDSTLDDVLNLKIDDLLSRRLQTIVQKNMSFKTPYQARQMIVHRHIMIGDRTINIPSYRVKIEEENKITLDSNIKNKLSKTQDNKENT